jgi:hypothetical protein
VVGVCYYALWWYAQRRLRMYANSKVCELQVEHECDRRGSKVCLSHTVCLPQPHQDITSTFRHASQVDFTSLDRHDLTSSAFLATVTDTVLELFDCWSTFLRLLRGSSYPRHSHKRVCFARYIATREKDASSTQVSLTMSLPAQFCALRTASYC